MQPGNYIKLKYTGGIKNNEIRIRKNEYSLGDTTMCLSKCVELCTKKGVFYCM